MQLEILKLLQNIKEDLKAEKGYKPTRLRNNCKTSDNQIRPVRRLVSKYYWTHRACDHEGKDYMERSPWHKVEATKENMLGDTKVYYSWRCKLGNRLKHSKLHSLYALLTDLPADLYKHYRVMAKDDSEVTNHY